MQLVRRQGGHAERAAEPLRRPRETRRRPPRARHPGRGEWIRSACDEPIRPEPIRPTRTGRGDGSVAHESPCRIEATSTTSAVQRRHRRGRAIVDARARVQRLDAGGRDQDWPGGRPRRSARSPNRPGPRRPRRTARSGRRRRTAARSRRTPRRPSPPSTTQAQPVRRRQPGGAAIADDLALHVVAVAGVDEDLDGGEYAARRSRSRRPAGRAARPSGDRRRRPP